MFLKNIPVVYELKNKEILPLNELDVATEVYKKWSLGVKCSYCKKNPIKKIPFTKNIFQKIFQKKN